MRRWCIAFVFINKENKSVVKRVAKAPQMQFNCSFHKIKENVRIRCEERRNNVREFMRCKPLSLPSSLCVRGNWYCQSIRYVKIVTTLSSGRANARVMRNRSVARTSTRASLISSFVTARFRCKLRASHLASASLRLSQCLWKDPGTSVSLQGPVYVCICKMTIVHLYPRHVSVSSWTRAFVHPCIVYKCISV